MTFPPCIQSQSCIEASVIFALAHKLSGSGANILNGNGSTSGLLDVHPPVALAKVYSSAANKYPLAGSPPECPTKKKVRTCRPSCSLPNTNDPMEEIFCMKLYTAEDEGKVNPMHNVIRRFVLDVRRTVSGKIFFQCTCCKHLPRRERAKCSTLAPQSISSLYRAMIRFMMYHVQECEHIPQQIKDLSSDDKVCGTKNYWRESAKKIGLRDGENGMNNIVYCHPTK